MWRQQGRRAALVVIGIFATVVVAITLPSPFSARTASPRASGARCRDRSRSRVSAASFLLVAHQVFGLGITMRSGHGRRNLAGVGPDVIAVSDKRSPGRGANRDLGLVRARPGQRERLLRASAAALCAFIVFGKVFSPQFLICSSRFVPLVRDAAALRSRRCWRPSSSSHRHGSRSVTGILRSSSTRLLRGSCSCET